MYITKASSSFPWKQTVNIPLVVEERENNEPSIHCEEFRDEESENLFQKLVKAWLMQT